ncbi:molybdopterin-dependent oxidoreductase [Micromonospora echinofusca]|uniref:Molybdopterin-dependent oxidoreductase n=1 Tax=Micromonospora echinofusca TaxID=47858 RepID=A0ABS3VYM6_MICEH|nr:molybdopterin-dependent oxidoreductase [Micromonospora echinofusca]MBO4209625.1 molybdopterin-dependent oxidoreductase [Micromonospora echinofusca]
MRWRPPGQGNPAAEAHDVRVSARLGLWLATAFALCLATGLLSHLAQHAPWWPGRPAQLYRITQGVHVLAGTAAVPLLLAKLWSCWPRLSARPEPAAPRGPAAQRLGRRWGYAAERAALAVLVAGAVLTLTTGLVGRAGGAPGPFATAPTHHAVAWLTVGALAVHLGVKLPRIRDGLATPLGRPAPERVGLSRRDVLGGAYLSATAVVLATVGSTVPALDRVSPLARRADRGPQGLRVTRTASAARVTRVDARWRLTMQWPGGRHEVDLPGLAGLPQRTLRLPLTCVQGWSAHADWTGVPLVDLLAAVGAPVGRVTVGSLEPVGVHRSSVLPVERVRDRSTLLALRINGSVLDLDHGYPCRIVSADRPGTGQTKWVTALRVDP